MIIPYFNFARALKNGDINFGISQGNNQNNTAYGIYDSCSECFE